MAQLKEVSKSKHFGGEVIKYEHQSKELGCAMKFNAFLPPQALAGNKVPVLWFLSGLTCTEDNFFQKSNAFKKCAELGIAVIGPDTSPRGVKIEGDSDSWDFGVAAGFYLDATNGPWAANYRMYSYITKELYGLISSAPEFASFDTKRMGITGHSMGGHGALTIYLTSQPLFKSVSAFAPIVNPSSVPWGIKAFTGYLGEDKSQWLKYDATEIVKSLDGAKGKALDVLIDQGSKDSFMPVQLQPEKFEEAVKAKGGKCELRIQPDYDHSYWFIATFIDDHIQFAYDRLSKL